MKKISVLFLFLFCFGMNHMNASDEQLEKIYLEGGYKEVNEALQEAKDFFKQDIALPTRLPPIAYTHHFGIFSTSAPQLEITYLSEDSGHTHYKIYVRSLKYKLKIKAVEHKVKLNDGSEAIYLIRENFDELVFEKDGLQYVLLVDKIHPDKITKEVLVKIADSIK